jgi:hypothetical protein
MSIMSEFWAKIPHSFPLFCSLLRDLAILFCESQCDKVLFCLRLKLHCHLNNAITWNKFICISQRKTVDIIQTCEGYHFLSVISMINMCDLVKNKLISYVWTFEVVYSPVNDIPDGQNLTLSQPMGCDSWDIMAGTKRNKRLQTDI